MNRTIKEATVKRYYYQTLDQLKEHLRIFLTAYNFAKRLKTLNGLTAYEYVIKCWQNQKDRFKLNPHHDTLGLNSLLNLLFVTCFRFSFSRYFDRKL